MKLDLKKFPGNVLRSVNHRIGDVRSKAITELIESMCETVKYANGIGLAAPQIGKNLQLAVINLEHIEIPIFALINPKITKISKSTNSMEEGCLSIPGAYGIVERPERIAFIATGVNGREIKGECEGLLAKVIQHEIDHLNGVLIIDKIKKYTKGKHLIQ